MYLNFCKRNNVNVNWLLTYDLRLDQLIREFGLKLIFFKSVRSKDRNILTRSSFCICFAVCDKENKQLHLIGTYRINFRVHQTPQQK